MYEVPVRGLSSANSRRVREAYNQRASSPRRHDVSRPSIKSILDIYKEINRDNIDNAIQFLTPHTSLSKFFPPYWGLCLLEAVQLNNAEALISHLLGQHITDTQYSKENDESRRALLDEQIQTIGKIVKDETDIGPINSDQALKIASQILERFPQLATSVRNGWTVFHCAAEHKALKFIEPLQKIFASHAHLGREELTKTVRIKDKNSYTALLLAVKKSHLELVRSLYNLDPTQLTNDPPCDPGSMIREAIEADNPEILTFLLGIEGVTVQEPFLEMAINKDSIQMLNLLIRRLKTPLKTTRCLVYAVKKGKPDIVRTLIETFPHLVDDTIPGKAPVAHSIFAENISSNRALIQAILLPVLMRRHPVQIVRNCLADTLRYDRASKDICLDLSFFGNNKKGLTRILDQFRVDLSRLEQPKSMFLDHDEVNAMIAQKIDEIRKGVFRLAIRDAQSNDQTLSSSDVPEEADIHENVQELSDAALEKLGFSRDVLQNFTSVVYHKKVEGDDTKLLDVEFYSALKYVELPAFDQLDSRTYDEARQILHWLGKVKGVTKIFELRIDDSAGHPHSEEVIEDAIKEFDVEVLDWKRYDLSIHTILTAAPNVTKLKLYSSGNWAPIVHWMGNIRRLRKLEILEITIVTDFISEKRAEEYRTRLEACHKAQRLGPVLGKKKYKLQFLPVRLVSWEREMPPDGDEPRKEGKLYYPGEITHLEFFSSKYEGYQRWLQKGPNKFRLLQPAKTKVAVLDCGIDRSLFDPQEHYVTGISYCHPAFGNKESQYWLATDPHGSHICNIISQIDPCCSFYIAKVAENKHDPKADRVIKAIDWAIDQRVDIINLSLVLFKEDDEVWDAVKRAANNNIVIICSTADQGLVTQEVWPAMYSIRPENSIIPIAATSANGRLMEYSSETFAHYTLQGENVTPLPTPSPDAKIVQRQVSGSSVATAMATGVASLVLACHRIANAIPGCSTKMSKSPNQTVIKEMFKHKLCIRTSTDDSPKHWPIKPEKVFPTKEDAPKEYDWGEPQEVQRWIQNVYMKMLDDAYKGLN